MKIKQILDMTLAGFAALSMFAVSCRSTHEPDIPPQITIQNPSVTAGAGSQFIAVTASGEWTIDVSEPWGKIEPKKGVGSKSSIVLSYEANVSEKPRMLEIVVISSGGRASVEMTQQGGKSVSGGNSSSAAGISWLELPATDSGDGHDFFTHTMKIGASVTRNYSFYWDYDNLVACWVAYPMSPWNIGSSVSRTDNWGLDPLLSADKQPVLYKGFKEGNSGWYARGHQCASADRLANYDANSQTFYFTNMTPQINDRFNSGIWASLEGAVRRWANSSDTVYVVTGCVTEGSTKYALDNEGKHVTVPVGYYKAILRYKKNSTIGFSDFMATAYYFEHKEYSGNDFSKYSMSVDELEKKLGMDFFVNLPAMVGESIAAQIEAQDPSTVSWW